MNKNKETLAIKLNLEFDEIINPFSEEILSSMEQDDLLGGVVINIVCPCPTIINIVCPICPPPTTQPTTTPPYWGWW